MESPSFWHYVTTEENKCQYKIFLKNKIMLDNSLKDCYCMSKE
nr:MAG TPA: hypothetical protein [Caudoviricetes sp.]